jgi:hypothetical protein
MIKDAFGNRVEPGRYVMDLDTGQLAATLPLSRCKWLSGTKAYFNWDMKYRMRFIEVYKADIDFVLMRITPRSRHQYKLLYDDPARLFQYFSAL